MHFYHENKQANWLKIINKTIYNCIVLFLAKYSCKDNWWRDNPWAFCPTIYLSDHWIHSDSVCTWTMASAEWPRGSQLWWGWGIILMGGEPIKLTEWRAVCTERNWQGMLASRATQNQRGACTHFGLLTSPVGVWSDFFHNSLQTDSRSVRV